MALTALRYRARVSRSPERADPLVVMPSGFTGDSRHRRWRPLTGGPVSSLARALRVGRSILCLFSAELTSALWSRRRGASFSEAFDVMPGGTGDAPSSFLIALPFAVLLRLLAWPVESVRGGSARTRRCRICWARHPLDAELASGAVPRVPASA